MHSYIYTLITTPPQGCGFTDGVRTAAVPLYVIPSLLHEERLEQVKPPNTGQRRDAFAQEARQQALDGVSM
jgi:hypothetical protein